MPADKLSAPFSYHALRLSLGLIYFHFGFLKFLPGVSPAEGLAGQTINRLTCGWIEPGTALFLLALFECGLGLALILNLWKRTAFILFLFHMVGTFTPFFVLPETTFKGSPLAPTLEGQYILKNIVFVVAVSTVFVPEVLREFSRKRTTWKASILLTHLLPGSHESSQVVPIRD